MSIPISKRSLVFSGSRTLNPTEEVFDAVVKESGVPMGEIVYVLHGGCRGVDEAAGKWAMKNRFLVMRYPANWTLHGKAAGPLRNIAMIDTADYLIAIWDGVSAGTKQIIEYAKSQNKKVHVHYLN